MKKNPDFIKKTVPALAFLFLAPCVHAESGGENAVKLSYSGGGNYTLVERTDLRRYDNGRYTGLTSREVRSFINRVSPTDGGKSGDAFYEGSFFLQEDTKRNSGNVGDGIQNSIPSAFRITGDGQLVMSEDMGYPTFRSFPAFSSQEVRQGDRWQANAVRCVDPLNRGRPTKLPMYVEYTFLGEARHNGEDVYVLQARWATRYGLSYTDSTGDPELKSAAGSHNATMHISRRTGHAIVVRDSVDETFVYADGNRISFRGTITLFTEYPPAIDREKLIPSLQRLAGITQKEAEELKTPVMAGQSKKIEHEAEKTSTPQKPSAIGGVNSTESNAGRNFRNDLKVENTESGIRLTMQNLKFKSDSDELLNGEEERLDSIASLLMEIPEGKFLVEGHTADVGYREGELSLSRMRARTIAVELSRRGISEERFIVRGSGSTKPVADNTTDEGRAKNRRVEITILD